MTEPEVKTRKKKSKPVTTASLLLQLMLDPATLTARLAAGEITRDHLRALRDFLKAAKSDKVTVVEDMMKETSKAPGLRMVGEKGELLVKVVTGKKLRYLRVGDNSLPEGASYQHRMVTADEELVTLHAGDLVLTRFTGVAKPRG